MTYDLNGNIKTLTRYGGLDSSPAQKIDQLTYSYSGNALTKVLDASGNTQGYPLGGAVIPYDANGNMKSQLDKGLSLIDYNHLNLPSKIIHGANTATYSYLADGTKLKKTYGAKTTEYYGALQYEGPEGTPVLQFASTSEGYFDFVKNAYIYNYLDHLGNRRLSYRKNSAGVLEILEETNYYPFGLKHEGYNGGSTATASYKYKFGGKELQESGMYDFGARMYMPDIGRWSVVDPLAEKHPEMSPYVYAANNPVKYIDPDGRDFILAILALNRKDRSVSKTEVRAIVYITGANASVARANELNALGKNTFKSRKINGAEVGFNVKYIYKENITKKDLKPGENIMNFVNEEGRSHIEGRLKEIDDNKQVFAGNTGNVFSNGDNDTVMHETGHLLGLPDRYDDTYDFSGKTNGFDAHPGFEGDLMGGGKGLDKSYYQQYLDRANKYKGKDVKGYLQIGRDNQGRLTTPYEEGGRHQKKTYGN